MDIGGPVVLKILSRQISHKSDVGGVKLDLNADQVQTEAWSMLQRVRQQRPDANIDGFTVQQMVKRPLAEELLLGAVLDPTFGPCLMFGHGGTATEVICDRCIGLPPLNSNLARDMINRTRVSKLLAGYRDRPAAKLDDIAGALIALSDLVIDFPEIVELDINPLLADADGVIALDARVAVRRPEESAAGLAIRPYPEALVRDTVVDHIPVRIRPIRPEDSTGIERMVARSSIEDLRLRFHGAGVRIGPAEAARLAQIDYDREMALIAELTDGEIGGVVRAIFTPDFVSAELAIIIRSDLQQHGLGRVLLTEALEYSRTCGAGGAWGNVLTTNRQALAFFGDLGARLRLVPGDATLTRADFRLDGPGPNPA
jgi:acetyltransferase